MFEEKFDHIRKVSHEAGSLLTRLLGRFGVR